MASSQKQTKTAEHDHDALLAKVTALVATRGDLDPHRQSAFGYTSLENWLALGAWNCRVCNAKVANIYPRIPVELKSEISRRNNAVIAKREASVFAKEVERTARNQPTTQVSFRPKPNESVIKQVNRPEVDELPSFASRSDFPFLKPDGEGE